MDLVVLANKSTQVFELFQKCPLSLQKRLNGHPNGWTEEVRKDTMARIKIVSLWTKWATEETVGSLFTHLTVVA